MARTTTSSTSKFHLLLFFLGQLASAQQCYFPNNTAFPDDGRYAAYAPCEGGRPDARNKACCVLNPNAPNVLHMDVCLPNGLCLESVENTNPRKTQFWQFSCSDPTGEGCVKACPFGTDKPSGAVRLTPCGSDASTERWCCGTSDACCSNDNDPLLVTIPRFINVATEQPSSPSSDPIPPSDCPDPSISNMLTTSARAGIGVGVGVGVLALLGGAFFLGLIFARRRFKKGVEAQEQGQKTEIRYAHYVEAPTHGAIVELPGAEKRNVGTTNGHMGHMRNELPS